MSEVISARGTVSLTERELNYLQQFLNANDRAGYYATYQALVSSESSPVGTDAEFGKREASLQMKIATFSEETGAAAFLANRLLQERNPSRYAGIYLLSQQVAQISLDAMKRDRIGLPISRFGGLGDRDGLLSDGQFFTTPHDAWENSGTLDLFPGLVFYGNSVIGPNQVTGIPTSASLLHPLAVMQRLAQVMAPISIRILTGETPTRTEFADIIASDGAFASLLAPIYLYRRQNVLGGVVSGGDILIGKDVDGIVAADIITSPDGQLRMVVKDGKVVAVETSGLALSDSAFELMFEIGPSLLDNLLSVVFPGASASAKEIVYQLVRQHFDSHYPAQWSQMTEAPGATASDGDYQPGILPVSAPINAIRSFASSGNDTLFGNRTTSGFAALAALDSNADGVIDSADAAFSTLRLWKDANSNAVTDAGELVTLASAGIASISLASVALDPQDPEATVRGNSIVREGSFTRSDGTTGSVGNVALVVSDTDTRWTGSLTTSVAPQALPQAANDVKWLERVEFCKRVP